MSNVFKANLDRFVLVYLDDILVYGPTMDERIAHLKTVFEKLRGNKLYTKRKACTFGMTHVGYLGHVVGNGKVRADQNKVTDVTEQCCVEDQINIARSPMSPEVIEFLSNNLL